jgi:hypothetical protein
MILFWMRILWRAHFRVPFIFPAYLIVIWGDAGAQAPEAAFFSAWRPTSIALLLTKQLNVC